MTGGQGADWFKFETGDTGDVYAGKADTITDFNQAEGDKIMLKGSYAYAGETATPGEGQYGIWQKDGGYVVTYNSTADAGYHDIVVKGDNPQGDVSFY